MSRLGTITRRGLVIGAVAVAGGVAFGAWSVRRPHANPLADGLAEGAATFNPWVRIDADAVTLVTPHSDLGQGARSMQALLIAEEMDLDWGGFRTEYGPPAPAYWNRALADEGAPFMAHDDGTLAEGTRAAMGAAIKLLGLQITGGSTSVPDSWVKLREAGAVARETLKRAAAAEARVHVRDVRTEAGAVILPDGTRRPYTALAARAARIDPVTDVTLRDPSAWRLIGQSLPRLDIPAKSTGAQTYGIDLSLPDMLHASVRTNPGRGPLEDFDAEAARAMPGVVDVVEVTNGVAVLAADTWTAMRAVHAIACRWGPAPYPAEQATHWQRVSDSFTDAALDKEWRHDGDVPGTLTAEAAITAEYRAPYVAHQPLEPLNATARVADGRVEVWAAHQIPRFVERIAAETAGVAPEAVTFHQQDAGGSFGHRLEFENIRLAVEIAAQAEGRPVKLTFTREEDFAQDFPRQISIGRARGTVGPEGIVAVDIEIASASASRSQMARAGQPLPGPDKQIPSGVWNQSYAIPHFRCRAYTVDGLAPTSSWRSVGASSAGFFWESVVDELLHAAGRDPLEARIAMCTVPHHRATLEAVAEMCDWAGPLGDGRGRGVAMIESFGVPCAQVVEVEASEAGLRIPRVWVALDVGRVVDPMTFENQVQGGVIWGLGHAMNSEITYAGGRAEQRNYDAAPAMRLHQAPEIAVRGLETAPEIRGAGEPPVPPAAPALANAIFAATGRRLREMPFSREIAFV
ncbi:Isoquinoline 1-oxidoreductase subunit beta [Roseivivax jejudonensis]|uniref:Isoquinoline 1-oxidoreductase subunit beta n=1 Tax=Roseivivax jejudonensis TaxID=1529041 RepID=A0A1X7A1Z0_9RHOB|nr:molybdopterin cofactor-binding domain-containing protein [Roseivivax jejudonensis]SLN67818.1 Isoquinoline 1-oxidoreductase subunit beta [Roseivivax jejudonensis]